VLEGDFTTSNSPTIVSTSDADEEQVSLFYRPKLLEMNDGASYAYSNSLIPYLLHNVITNKDIIGENISYAKELIGISDTVNYWNNNIKYLAFVNFVLPSVEKEGDYSQQLMKNIRKDCFDVTGFIDK